MIHIHLGPILRRRATGGAAARPGQLLIAGLFPFLGVIECPYLLFAWVCSRPAFFDALYGLRNEIEDVL